MIAKITVEVQGEEKQVGRAKITKKQFELLRKTYPEKTAVLNEVQATGKITKENLDMLPQICVTCEWFENCDGVCAGGCDKYDIAVDADR